MTQTLWQASPHRKYRKALSFFTTYLFLMLPLIIQPLEKNLTQVKLPGNAGRQVFYENLLKNYRDLIVQTQIVSIDSFGRQKTIGIQTSSVFLDKEYLKEFPQSTRQTVRYNLTRENLESIKSGSVFVRTTFFADLNGKKKHLYEQMIPYLGQFASHPSLGPKIFIVPDSLFNSTQTKALKRMEIIFFPEIEMLPFKENGQGTIFSKIVEIVNGTQRQKLGFFLPFAKKVNTMEPDNYGPLQDLCEGSTQQLKINFIISEANYLPLFLQYVAIYANITRQPSYLIEQEHKPEFGEQLIFQFLKRMFLQESSLGWIFLILQILLTFFSIFSTFMGLIISLWIYKKGVKYRGISLSARLLVFSMMIVDIMLKHNLVIGILTSIFVWYLLKWMVNKIARISWVWKYPFFVIEGQEWYKTYEKKDRECAEQLQIALFVLLLVIVAYPFILEDYKTYLQLTNQSAWSFCLARIGLACQQYTSVFCHMCQILLNYKLKSGNGVSWALTFFNIFASVIDNMIFLITPSIWVALFHLKEEILLLVLVYQKLTYGDNWQAAPPRVQNPANGMENNNQNGNEGNPDAEALNHEHNE